MRQELLAMICLPLTPKQEDGTPQRAIGTGYPIRDGLVLTARHVLYPENRDETAKPQLSWCMQDKGEPYHTDPMGEVLYEHEQYDLALIRCNTPLLTETVQLAAQVPRSKEAWESLGYPNGGKDDGGVRSKTSADGTVKSDTGGHVRHLDVSDHVPPEIWQGMSGAPVFKLHSNTLLGVWTHGNRDFPDRIMMTSLAYVLSDCVRFREQVGWVENSDSFTPVVQYLTIHSSVRQALVKLIQQQDPSVGDTVLAVVKYLVALDLGALFKTLKQARKNTQDPLLRSGLAQLAKLLLPSVYDRPCLAMVRAEAGGLAKIPYATSVSAEMLMTGAIQRDMVLEFYPISSTNPQLAAVPGLYCLGLPPESGSGALQPTLTDMEDDLFRRVGSQDIGKITSDIDQYLYDNIPQKSRASRSLPQKQIMVNNELKRLLERDQAGQYYWILQEGETGSLWPKVASYFAENYPSIRLLCLADDFDKEEREKDLFADLPDILKD